ncbi:acyl carrier protein [Novosphingobium sp. ZW T3_23]|uniref:acyl carrier protein n=1 Tax=Novosphingobium sp. ZW T3_23 TaxID=3378084 RepID=UPI0038539DB0
MSTREDVRTTVYECVAETFNFPTEDLSEGMNAGDIGGWDSISTSYLILNMEEKFNVDFPVDELIECENLGAMIDLVLKTIHG